MTPTSPNSANGVLEAIEDQPVSREAAAGPSKADVVAVQEQKMVRAKAARRTAVLVLGMHRSGTSAVTRVISLLGAALPSNLLPAQSDNETGFWESVEIFRLNDQILASAGSRWDDWRHFNPDWVKSAAKDDFKAQALEILHREYAESTFFVLKDPRVCRLLPFWLEVLRDFDTEPKCVLPIRNPLEVAASLRRRNGFSPDRSLVLWLRYVLDVECGTRQLPRVLLTYDALLEDWRRVVAKLSDGLDIAWARRSATSEVEIDRFLADRHRHHSVGDERVLDHPGISTWVKGAYAAMIKLCATPDSKRAWRQLEKVGAEFDRACDALGAVLRSEEMARDELESTVLDNEARVGVLEQAASARESRIHELEQATLDREARISELERAVSAGKAQIAELKDVVAEREARAGELEHVVAKRDVRVGVLEQAIAERDVRVATLGQAIAERDVRVAALEQAIAERDVRVGTLEQAVTEREVRIAGLEQAARAREVRIKELGQTVSARERRIADMEQAASAREVQVAELALVDSEKEARIRALEDAGSAREGRIDELVYTISVREARITELERAASASEARIGKLRCEVSSRKRDKDAILQIKRQLLDRLNGFQTSPWWQLALPLRFAQDRWPRFVRGIVAFPKLAWWAITLGLPGRLRLRQQANELLATSLFDLPWYVEENPDVVLNGANPVLHWLTIGWKEGRDPNPLFNTAWYLAHNPDVADSGINPLAHYLRDGAAEGRDPNPLFDTGWYLARNPDVAESGVNPLVHYLRDGAAEGRDPSPMFDVAWYLATTPDVAGSRKNPLAHYLDEGAVEGGDPNPMFDTAWYLAKNPDVAGSGTNPLLHYLGFGASEGRDPGPQFDTSRYLEQNPEVARSGLNPLAHYLRQGAGGRHRSSAASCDGEEPEQPLVPDAATAVDPTCSLPSGEPLPVPMTYRVERACAPKALDQGAPAVGPTILVVAHMPSWPRRAGNEYRLGRMLDWLSSRGYKVVLVYAPLPGAELNDRQVREMASRHRNLVVCFRDGRIRSFLDEADDPAAVLHDNKVFDYGGMLGENVATPEEQHLVGLERAFCHDPLVGLLLALETAFRPCLLYVSYIWMTRFLPLCSDDSIAVIDTIDVFSTKHEKVVAHGIEDALALTPKQEAVRLRRAKGILAIQQSEAEILRNIAPDRDIMIAGTDFDFDLSAPRAPSEEIILYVASDNPMNVKGIQDFLRLAWPMVKRKVPQARLLVVGTVGKAVISRDPAVRTLGVVDQLAPLYGACRLVINPAAAGTGLKIKTVEALSYFRRVVTWPAGTEGIDRVLLDLCLVATDWFGFAEQCIAALNEENDPIDSEMRKAISEHLSADEVYRDFAAWLDMQTPDLKVTG